MNITKHARRMYIERIKEITEKSMVDLYYTQNESQIDEWIEKLFEFSSLIYTGQIGGDKTTKDFYLNGDVCLVVKDNNTIITIYKLNFAFPERTRKVVIQDLIDEIQNLRTEIKQEKMIVDEQFAFYDLEENRMKLEIVKLKEQIEIFESEIKINQSRRSVASKKLTHLNTCVKAYAEQLLGNTEYKKDIE